MNLVEVLPLAPSLPFETLHYYGKEDFAVGDLVEVSIKRRKIYSIVTAVSPLRNERTAIRQASFTLKKIEGKKKRAFLPPSIGSAVAYAASCVLTPTSQLLFDLIPSRIVSQKEIPEFPSHTPEEELGRSDPGVIMQPKEERYIYYKRLIRELFAKKQSITFFFPTLHECTQAYEILQKGIEDYIFVYHSGIPQKELHTLIRAITKNEHPVVIISTPSLVPLLSTAMTTFVIEREHSLYYFTHGDRGYDMRHVLSILLTTLKKHIIYGSHLLSLQSYQLLKEGRAIPVMPPHLRNDIRMRLVPMNKDNYAATPHLSYATQSVIKSMKQSGHGHYFLYAHRKGMYPTTVCSDCSTLLTCTNCHSPFILHMIGGARTYVCHQCENVVRITEESSITCSHCGGWRMRLLGIATGGVVESLIPLDIPIFVIDGETTPTKEKAKRVFADWKKSNLGVLVGTEMALNMIDSCDGITIVSLDSLFSLPEYSVDEKIISIITEAHEKVPDGGLIVQTRLHDHPIFEYLGAHSFTVFFDSILEIRRESALPPYYVIIKLLFSNLRDQKKKSIETFLSGKELRWYEAGGGRTFLFVHIHSDEWHTDEKLRKSILSISEEKPLVDPPHLFS